MLDSGHYLIQDKSNIRHEDSISITAKPNSGELNFVFKIYIKTDFTVITGTLDAKSLAPIFSSLQSKLK